MRAGVEGVDVAAIGIDNERAEFTHDGDDPIGADRGGIATGAGNASDSGAIRTLRIRTGRAAAGNSTGDDIACRHSTACRNRIYVAAAQRHIGRYADVNQQITRGTIAAAVCQRVGEMINLAFGSRIGVIDVTAIGIYNERTKLPGNGNDPARSD